MLGERRKRVAQLAVLLIAATVAAWWLLHPRPSDEELILDLVAKAEHGLETKDKDEIMECVAEDYRDESGLSRVDIFRLALHWERSSEQVEVAIDEYELHIESPTATGRFLVQLEFQQAGRYEPPLRLPLGVTFERQRRGWRKVWLVKSVSGHDIERRFEEFY
jgi:hypothetical protein